MDIGDSWVCARTYSVAMGFSVHFMGATLSINCRFLFVYESERYANHKCERDRP